MPSGIFPVPKFRPTASDPTRPSLGLRVRTRRRRNRLDSDLAQGVDPAASAALGLRAAQLRSASGRRRLANALVETLGDARGAAMTAGLLNDTASPFHHDSDQDLRQAIRAARVALGSTGRATEDLPRAA